MTRNNFIIGLILNLSVYANSCSISSGEEEVAPGTAQIGYMYLHQDMQKQPIPQESKDQLDDQKAYDQLPEIYKDVIDETFGGIIGLRSVYNSPSYTSLILYNTHCQLAALHGDSTAQEHMGTISLEDADESYNSKRWKKLFESKIWFLLSERAQPYYYNDDGDIVYKEKQSLASIIKEAYTYANDSSW